MERDGWIFEYKTEGLWIGTSTNGVLIMLHHDMGICDQFPLVDLRDPELCRDFAQIKANHQIAVAEHVMMNVAEKNDAPKEELNISEMWMLAGTIQTPAST